jgi:DMSO/TMAO reductase YedYZ molybdopterin-dependent catalytic subunit
MKKMVFGLLLAALLVFTGCVSAPAAESAPEVDDVSSATPAGSGWMVELTGVRNGELWESDLQAWLGESYVELSLEKKGETHLYGGILFSEVVAMVDDPDGSMPYSFQEDLWKEGYDITLTAADGYSATFFTADVNPETMMLAVTMDGQPIPLQVAGDFSSKLWIQDLVSVELSLAPVALEENSFTLELAVNGVERAYTLKEMEQMDIYVEDKGTYINSYGNSFTNVWGGVKLVPLLEQFMVLEPDTSLKIVAMDGYEMTFGGEMLLDMADGDWILAFKENGEYMPEDPGYIRLVKVGPKNPEISGHSSARMVKRIVTEGVPFKDFSLTLTQRDLTEVFDRQTMQSGVTTHKTRVSYYDRKSDSDIPYMGMPLWRVIERPTGYKAVELIASDGFTITLDNAEVEGNDDVIIAMFTGDDDQLLSADEWPLRLVWDKDAALVPAGIKSIKSLVEIRLIY